MIVIYICLFQMQVRLIVHIRFNIPVGEDFFFYLVGLHYPPTDFQYSKKKKKKKKNSSGTKLSVTLYTLDITNKLF